MSLVNQENTETNKNADINSIAFKHFGIHTAISPQDTKISYLLLVLKADNEKNLKELVLKKSFSQLFDYNSAIHIGSVNKFVDSFNLSKKWFALPDKIKKYVHLTISHNEQCFRLVVDEYKLEKLPTLYPEDADELYNYGLPEYSLRKIFEPSKGKLILEALSKLKRTLKELNDELSTVSIKPFQELIVKELLLQEELKLKEIKKKIF